MILEGPPRSPNYLFDWNEEDKTSLLPIREAARSGNREQVQLAAQTFARAQFGVGEDVLYPDMPSWITNEILMRDSRLKNRIIVLLPPQSLVAKPPTSELYNKCLTPGNRFMWFKMRCDDRGVIKEGASELVDSYGGVDLEEKDLPGSSNPLLN